MTETPRIEPDFLREEDRVVAKAVARAAAVEMWFRRVGTDDRHRMDYKTANALFDRWWDKEIENYND